MTGETFVHEGMVHTFLFYEDDQKVTTVIDGGMIFPQIWDYVGAKWVMRPLNLLYTVHDILCHVMINKVACLDDFNWETMRIGKDKV